MLIDLSSDKGLAHFHAINRVLNLPEFVKQADFQEQIEVDALPREAFADSLERKFPVHTKAAAFMSYAYFAKQASDMGHKERNRCIEGFRKAASFWGLDNEFSDIAKAFEPKVEKTASAPSITPTFVMSSAEKLAADPGRFAFADRSALAKQLMKDAAAVGLPLGSIPEAVHKMAGFGITTKTAALLELHARYDTEKRPTLAQPLKTCIDALNKIGSDLIGGEVCEKIAAILDRYDRAARPESKSFPEAVLFAFTKHAADKAAGKLVTLIDGTSYHIADLEKSAEALNVLSDSVNLSDLRNLDGSLNMAKVADCLETLPRIDADNLKMALQLIGTFPAKLDKQAMVAEAATMARHAQLTDIFSPFTVVTKATEKRANILQQLEAQDPIVRRALETIRNLKTAEDKSEESEDEKKAKSPKARGIGGLFIKHAPNETEAAPAK